MALPKHISAYDDCLDHFDRATRATRGIRIPLATEREAIYLRNRLNQCRAIERQQSRRIYPPGDHRYDKSLNDKFAIRVLPAAEGETGWWVYIEIWEQPIAGEIEEL